MILILTQCFPPTQGGVETLMRGMARAVAETGRDVTVFADAAEGAAPHDADERYRIDRFGGMKPIRRRLKAASAARLIRSGLVTGVFCDSWKSLEHLPVRDGDPPIVCLAHGMELPPEPTPAKRKRIRGAFAKARRVLANSRWTASAAEGFVGQPDRVGVATPPIEPQPELDPAVRAALAERLPAADPLIATLCRLEPRKGVDRLIDAMPALSVKHPSARLAIAGDGPDRARLEALAQSLEIADRVAFLGRVDEAEKAALFDLADLFAMPARRDGASVEGFGIVYLEAAWRGTPALAGQEGGAADAVRDGRTGLLCDGADIDSVVEGLRTLIDNRPRLAEMSSEAAREARRALWSTRVDDYLSALNP